ncbi:S8 family serine peptidase [Agromyces sp. ZXT2-3]|uniref:S8 family serine peptidase n=1 Tax=Agromyces sp. ZXT2-3 TaxID=3461152 RepID=UPI0040551732
MPPTTTPPTPRRRHAVAAALSGLAIGVAGVGAAAVPAAATPAGDSAPPASTTSAAPGGRHSVTLITGDRVTVTDLADGTFTVDLEPATPGEGFQTAEVDGDLHVMPRSAMPYVAAGVIDDDLFNVSQLIEFGYDDASVDATPVIVEYDEGRSRRSVPVPGLEVAESLASINGAAAAAEHASATATWAALRGAAASARPFGAAAPGAAGTDDAAPDAAAPELRGGIEAIHLDGKVPATLDSSVPWIGAAEAWDAGYTGEGVTVAVLDSGYDDTHPDLAGAVLPDSMSFVPGEDVADDPHGHGTHVASTIAGTGAAGGGTHRGVADGADLLVGKVLGADGYGQESWIIAGMEWAAERADIVSMSLGTPQGSDGTDVMSAALDEIAEETGALFVVAAGNSSAPGTIGSPGAAASALTVGSVDDPTGALSWFSSQGPLLGSGALKPELVGPGNDVTAARSADSGGDGPYLAMSGTSMATPHVAGAAAIVKQQHPEYTGDELRAALVSTTTDVGLSPYQAGAGVVDVDQAIDAPVIATGSGDFGMLAWGEPATSVERVVEFENRSDAEVVLDLTVTLDDTTPGQGGGGIGPLSVIAPAGVLTMDADRLTIPAGETRSVILTAEPGAVPAGAQFSGALIASIAGEPVTRTALGIIAEAERYDLTVTATGLDGEPAEAYGWLWNAETGEIGVVPVFGETSLRMPAGTYSLMAFMDVAESPDAVGIALVGDPHVDLDGDATVAFDARAAEPVTVDVGDDEVSPVFRRVDYQVDGFRGSLTPPVWVDTLYAQPLDASDADSFDFTTRWRLQQTLALTAGGTPLDVIEQAGSTPFDGSLRARAVDVGAGSADEFAATDAAGKVAVVTRSDTVTPSERAANAAASGAKLLIVVNDADGELSEWVGADDYLTPVDLPVAAVSGIQGRELLDAMAAKTVTVKGSGVADATEIYDIVRYSEGEIPDDLHYVPDGLARIDTTYHGDGGTVGEFRYDFVPSTLYGSGFAMRTARGLERTEWVSTDEVEWYQEAFVPGLGWDVRDVRRAWEAGQVAESSFFGPIVRPNVGAGFWAPHRSGSSVQVNLPSWADGANPDRTGSFDVFSGFEDRAQLTELYVDGELVASTPYQAASIWGAPDGQTDWRVVNTATHDGSSLASSTETVTEWTFRSSGAADDLTTQLLPMIQAWYDVDIDASGRVGEGRKAGAAVPLGLELGHVAGASGAAELADATLEVRVADGDWQSVELELTDAGGEVPPEGPVTTLPTGRSFVGTYAAQLHLPEGGAWVDLRVTATDAAGNTFSQEIVRAFEVAAAKAAAVQPRGGASGLRP